VELSGAQFDSIHVKACAFFLIVAVMDYLYFAIDQGLFPQIRLRVLAVDDHRTLRAYEPWYRNARVIVHELISCVPVNGFGPV
jgi:hypothetical protein